MPAAVPIAIATTIGSVAKGVAADKAAGVASRAASNASTIEQQKLDQTQSEYQPYLDTGTQANSLLSSRLPELTAPVVMDQAALERTPGYQFTRNQGLKSVENSATARGLGVSGAAQKGASSFATGLADNTYQNQFNNAILNQKNAYDRLYNTTSLGENATTNLGVFRNKVGATQGQNSIDAGSAQSAGINAIGTDTYNGITNLQKDYQNYKNGLYSYQ